MKNLHNAQVIQRHMGGRIYWDSEYECFRVMRSDSPSLVRWAEHYTPISA